MEDLFEKKVSFWASCVNAVSEAVHENAYFCVCLAMLKTCHALNLDLLLTHMDLKRSVNIQPENSLAVVLQMSGTNYILQKG